MAPQPPICSDCITGSIHEGTPAGRTGNLHGLPTYIAEPPDGTPPKGLIVILPDVFGWEFTNTRVLADVYAGKGGFLVYLPDFYGSGLFLFFFFFFARGLRVVSGFLWGFRCVLVRA